MRTSLIAALLGLSLALVPACGGSSGGNKADASPGGTIDASTGGTIDAAVGGILACTLPGAAECNQAQPFCIGIANPGPGYCQPTCGMSADNMTPPTGGDAACAAAESVAPGVPVCVVPGTAAGGMVPWSCAITCGTGNMCPSPLTAKQVTGGCICVQP